ncbi:MAG: hypothetical protein CM15mP29_1750 [Alphaproteobacteria bacterium]|nr:MAG: hypothetical protein CM15mP29_1750 [Alphaproteobacteria bacterium]
MLIFSGYGSFFRFVLVKHIPKPLGYADVVTSTTHKVLGPSGGIILTNKEN